jgi:hypothetical protein
MLTYAETTSSSTFILVAPVPCSPSPENPTPEPQKDTSPDSSPAFVLPEPPDPASYIIGPIDPAKLITVQVQLTNGETLSCHIPPTIPLLVLMHPMFREGCEWGYTETDLEEVVYTYPKLLNDIFRMLSGLRFMEEADFCPWTIGFILGELARLAEADDLLALTGLAHYCFILSFLSPGSWGYFFLRLSWAHEFHQLGMKEYRARIRVYKEQGKSFAEAQRLALAGNE